MAHVLSLCYISNVIGILIPFLTCTIHNILDNCITYFTLYVKVALLQTVEPVFFNIRQRSQSRLCCESITFNTTLPLYLDNL